MAPGSRGRTETMQRYPAHATMLYQIFRNAFLDVYIAGFLGCDQYTAKDEEHDRDVYHTHILGSNPNTPREWRDAAGECELQVALGKLRGRRADIEALNRNPAVADTALFYDTFVGARSWDPQDVVVPPTLAHPSPATHEWLHGTPSENYAEWSTHLERRVQRHSCSEAPPGLKGMPRWESGCLDDPPKGPRFTRGPE